MRAVIVAPSVVGSFVRQDVECLSACFDVSLCIWGGYRSLVRLWRAVASVDAVVIWFASPHALPAIVFAWLAGVPVATIVGGYEVAWLPEIPYGVPPGSRWRSAVRWILSHSDMVLTVSDVTDAGTRMTADNRLPPMRRIYNAVDVERFRINTAIERRCILTVGGLNETTISVKGLRLFWETAARMPDCEFVAVGPAMDPAAEKFVAEHPPNLRWLGLLQGKELVRQFQSARVYFQGSLHESFSVATVEAMACGCIPVVSRHGALPEVVGSAGVYIDSLTPHGAELAIREALEWPESRRCQARQRVVDHFRLERRRDELCEAIRDMIATRQTGRRRSTMAAKR